MIRNHMRFESVARGVHRHCQNAWGLEMIGQSCGVPAGVVRWLIPMSLSSCMKMLFRILWCSGLYSTHKHRQTLGTCCPVMLSSMHPNIVFRGSTATIWSWSTGCVRGDSWKTRQCLAVLATPQVTANTREAICKLLAWDLRQLKLGVWDVVDSSGKFHPTDSKRERNAGHDMPLKAVPGPSDIGKTCVGFVLKFFCGLNLFFTS